MTKPNKSEHINVCLNCTLNVCIPDSNRCRFNKLYGIDYKPVTLYQNSVGYVDQQAVRILTVAEKKKIDKEYYRMFGTNKASREFIYD